jgi:hypothetical protein
MRVLVRVLVEGCLGLTVVAVATLLHLALRGALRRKNRKHGLADLPENGVFRRKEPLRRPFFLSRADER